MFAVDGVNDSVNIVKVSVETGQPTALTHGLTLVTRNVKDFINLEVTIVNPWEA